jgi:hypothetical protein
MPLAKMQNMAFNLVPIGLFGANAVMLQPDFASNPIEQLRRLPRN